MTSMFIPRNPGASRIDHPRALARRSPAARRFEVERLEARTALSGGLQASLAAMDSYGAEVAPALIGGVDAAWTALEDGHALPATSRSADAVPAASGTGTSEAPDSRLFAERYPNLLPFSSELITGLAGSIVLLGQAYRDSVPSSVLIDGLASAIGSTPAEIPPGVIPLGVAAALTAQEAGIALPATVSGLEGIAGGGQIGGGISAAVGKIEAPALDGGSTPPDKASIYGPPPTASTFISDKGEAYVQADFSGDPGSPGADPNARPAPPFLVSLGKFFLININVIFLNYVEHFDDTSGSMASPADGTAPNGLASVSDSTAATVQGAQDNVWAGVGGMSYVITGRSGPALPQGPASRTGGSGPALPQGPASRSDELQGPGSSPEDPILPASIAAGAIPLDILLSDPGMSTQGVSIGLQQFAELIPLADSSLALVATLWTVPSDARAEPADESDPWDEQAEPVTSSASPPPWAIFLIGLDEAFERSRDACGTTFSHGRRPSERDGAGDVDEGRLEWRCPIIPTAEGTRKPDRAEGSSLDVGAAANAREAPSPEEDPNRPSRAGLSAGEGLVARPGREDGRPHDAAEGRPLIEGAMRSVWAASAPALFVAWFWARRQRRRGWGPVGIGRADHRRGGREHCREEGL
jgi:hypothetical protein